MRVVFKEYVCHGEPFPLIQWVGFGAVACGLLYLVQYKKMSVCQLDGLTGLSFTGISFANSFFECIYIFILRNVK